MSKKQQSERPMMVDIIMDGPPSAEGGRFVEVETLDGQGLRAGEWVEKKDGLWALRLKVMMPIRKGKVDEEDAQHDDEYLDDLEVWKITIGAQIIWVTGDSRSEALGVAEGMDYFYDSWDDEAISIERVPPGKILEVWMCHSDSELIPELLKPYTVKPDELSEFSFITVAAPCALWAQSLKGRADLLADSEAYC